MRASRPASLKASHDLQAGIDTSLEFCARGLISSAGRPAGVYWEADPTEYGLHNGHCRARVLLLFIAQGGLQLRELRRALAGPVLDLTLISECRMAQVTDSSDSQGICGPPKRSV